MRRFRKYFRKIVKSEYKAVNIGMLSWLILFIQMFIAQACIRPYPGGLPDVLELMTQTAEIPPATIPVIAPDSPESLDQGSPREIATTVVEGASTPRTSSVSPLYALILVSEDNALNVRAAAGTDNPILEMLPPNSRDLRVTGEEQFVDGERWVEIQRLSGESGWVSSAFLTQQVSPDAFCSDPKVKQLVRSFIQAVAEKDGNSLSQMISPAQGLVIRLAWWNPEVRFGAGGLANIFVDNTEYSWGFTAGSGEPIEGSFSEVILPGLLDASGGEHVQVCNSLEINLSSGPTAGVAVWPFEYGNVNYMAIYRPAAPADKLNWRTWALGIEIIGGKPYIAFLVQYSWEP